MIKRLTYTLLFLLAGLAGMAQTNQPLPPGSKPFSNQLYLAPDSTVWTGDEFGGMFVKVAKWNSVDSLFKLGYTKAQVDSAITSRIGSIAFPVTSVNGETGDVSLDANDIGLGNVDNTSDLNKPISTATQNALDGKEDAFGKGSLVAGTGVTISGTLANRLVGSGNVTINATPNTQNLSISGYELSISGGNTVNIDNIRSVTSVDWGNIGGTMLKVGRTSTGAPIGALNVHGFDIPHQAGYGSALVFRNNRAWFRSLENGTLNPWVEIYHSGNFTPPTVFTVSANGLVPSPGSTTGDRKYLDHFGNWTVPAGGGGGGTATDLNVQNRTSTTLQISSSTGTAATIPAATTSLSGLMTAADKTKLNGVPSDFSGFVSKSGDVMTGPLTAPSYYVGTYLQIREISDGYNMNISGSGFGAYNKVYIGRTDGTTSVVTGDGNVFWHAGNLNPSNFLTTSYVPTWASISGKPSTFTPSAHNHNASDINAGTLAIARIPTGTTGSTVALGNHTHAFSAITGKPTTISGYGITDAVPSSRTVSAGNGLTGGGTLDANRSLAVGAGDGITVNATNVAVNSTVLRTTGNQTKSGTLGVTNIIGTSTTASSSIPTNAQSLFTASVSSNTTYTLTNLTGSPRHVQVMVTNTGSSDIFITFSGGKIAVGQSNRVDMGHTAIFTFLINNGSAYGTKTLFTND